MIEAIPENAVGMSSWWLRREANLMEIYAWIDENFKSGGVQRVIEYEGKRETDTCGEYYNLIADILGAAGAIYIDSSSITLDRVNKVSRFIMLKATISRDLMAQVKRERIEKLTKELALLEQEPSPAAPEGGANK